MNQVNLDAQDETVKQFVLGLTADPSGTVLRLNGQPVACVVPLPKSMNGAANGGPWNDAKNARRVALIKQKHTGGISPIEHVELAELQAEMLLYRQKVAPFPLDGARKIHQKLLGRASPK
jgi:hypothetical protein